MNITLKTTIFTLTILGTVPFLPPNILSVATATQNQEVTIKFQPQVGNQPFACGTSYKLGKPSTVLTPLDFRFYISDVSLIDTNGKAVPLQLTQDGKWQYQNLALIDFENKTGACANGTVETRNIIVGKVPQGNYKGIKFTLGVPSNLNHEDSTLASSPLNLTSLWWNWRFGYKFARIDFGAPGSTATFKSTEHKHPKKADESKSVGFPIHLGSTGCEAETSSQKPTVPCSNPNRSSIIFDNFDPNKNIILADVAKLVANTDLSLNQANTAPGCMSEPNDNDCKGIMASFGIPFGKQSTPKQTFFSVK